MLHWKLILVGNMKLIARKPPISRLTDAGTLPPRRRRLASGSHTSRATTLGMFRVRNVWKGAQVLKWTGWGWREDKGKLITRKPPVSRLTDAGLSSQMETAFDILTIRAFEDAAICAF